MRFFVFLFSFVICSRALQATPTSTFFTNCCTDVQETGTLSLEYDVLQTVHSREKKAQFLQDFGASIGAFSWNNLSCEMGLDYFPEEKYPLFFNTKIGVQEDILFDHAPAVNVGIFNVGTRTSGKNRTNENIVDFLVGKSFPEFFDTKLYAGLFSGSKAMGKERRGFMIGYSQCVYQVIDSSGVKFKKCFFLADYASGKNSIGGGGFSLKYYVHDQLSIQTGPTWFNDRSLKGRWGWALQIVYQT